MPATERSAPETEPLDPDLAELVANDFLDEAEARAEQEWFTMLAGKVVADEISLDDAVEAMEARARIVGQRARMRGVKAP